MNNQNAAEIWEQIEDLHKKDNYPFGKSFARTIKGVTYIYQVLPNGRLLSIDEWFDGFVDTMGSYEAGLQYAVKFGVDLISLYECKNGELETTAAVKIQSKKSTIKNLKKHLSIDIPLRVVLDYQDNGCRYWVIEIVDGTGLVLNLTENELVDKYQIKRGTFYGQGAIVYRFPFAPYKYAIISKRLPYLYEQRNCYDLIDLTTGKRYEFLGRDQYSFKCFTVYEYGNDRFAVYAYKKHTPIAFFEYDRESNLLKILIKEGAWLSRKKFKMGSLNVEIRNEKLKEYGNNIEYIIRPLEPLNIIIPDNQYMLDEFGPSCRLENVSNNSVLPVSLHKEFGSLLEKGFTSKKSVRLANFSLLKLVELFCRCDNSQDIDRLNCFLDAVRYRMRSSKFIYPESLVDMQVQVHELKLGTLVAKDVPNDSFFYPHSFSQEFYENCQFELSFSFSINNKSIPLEVDEQVGAVDNVDQEEELTFENLFDIAEDENLYDDPEHKPIYDHYVLL